ncbi:MAG: hypothetical protein JWN89_14 [Parcubacteria group bacterium]|nr:hypothetical protein [Parcubacteria group bacterium]
MQVDFDSMGRALGIHADAIRIRLGNSTQLQRLIRSAHTFLDIAALSSQFVEERHSGCGPKLEPEEKAEYVEKRAKLFEQYLAQFDTVEKFEFFGNEQRGNHLRILNTEEVETLSQKLCELLRNQISTIAKSETEVLSKLVALRVEIYCRYINDSEHDGASAYGVYNELSGAIRTAFFDEFRAASTFAERILVFKRLGDSIRADELQDRGRESSSHSALRALWCEASIEEILQIENEVPPRFVNSEEIEVRLASLVKVASGKIVTFDDRLTFAQTFASRDGYQASNVYTQALVSATEIAESARDLDVIRSWWTRRGELHQRSNDRYPGLPHAWIAKWDGFYLEGVEKAGLKTLASLYQNSPSSTQTHQAAERRLKEHFNALLEQAQTEEDVDRVEKTAEALVKSLYIGYHTRRQEIRKALRISRAQELWNIVENQLPIEGDEKKVLIGLFHEFKEVEPAKARAILLRLALHFPAELVDEVQIEK